MQNIEKYSKQLADIAMESDRVAVNRYTGNPCGCSEISCVECAFNNEHTFCSTQRKEWAQKEYQEPKCGMLNADAYENLREVIGRHIDKVYAYCNQSDCASCPYDHSANCRELLLFESMFIEGWALSRCTVDVHETWDKGHVVFNEESYSKLDGGNK